MVHAKIKPQNNGDLENAKVQMSRIEQLPVQIASKAFISKAFLLWGIGGLCGGAGVNHLVRMSGWKKRIVLVFLKAKPYRKLTNENPI